jgi:HK97 family phage portal protein
MALFPMKAALEMGPSGELVAKDYVSPVSNWMGNVLGPILEPFAGAWQRDMPIDHTENILRFSTIDACISIISDDIAKLRIKLCEDVNGIWEEITQGSPFLPVLRKPNPYQTRIQFLSQWMTSKLIYGNAYIYKERDLRGIVSEMYVLDPRSVTPLVTGDGEVLYQVTADSLARVYPDPESSQQKNHPVIPASEIIHDRMKTLFHPLVGISPLYAASISATQGRRIQNNSAMFFQNMSRPSGMLTAPQKIDNITADRLKQTWEQSYSGINLGRTFVAGDGLKYEPFTIPAEQAQLIEQQRWTVEDCARPFKMPLYKIGAGNPTVANAAQYNQEYYSECLQKHIEDIELLLEEGLTLPSGYHVELDLDGLLRMDAETRSRTHQTLVGSGIMAPNEARFEENLPPVEGGDVPYMQQQMWPIDKLEIRTPPDAGSAALPPPSADNQPEDAAKEMSALMDRLTKGFTLETL